ncbi:MAG: sigma-54-dependent Fis family transcriptional regulator, partial [Planctomycetales bacterium]|nr:sigma-54-dependent Fis family transcriptional regulator [Planctomycetales bacterium]
NGLVRLLVLTTGKAMSRGAAWQILAAGASDVLALDELGDPAQMIAARLQRWQAVDEIVASPL